MARAIREDRESKINGPRLLVSAGFLLALGVVGCTAFFNSLKGEAPVSPFPHKVHVFQEEIGCTDCHELPKGAGYPALPKKDLCMLCHEEKPEILSPFFQDDQPSWAHAGQYGDEIIFDHAKHAGDSDENCRKCHERVADSSAIYPDLMLTMEECEACHRTAAEQKDCALCHREIRQDSKPPSHGGAWDIQHGGIVSRSRANEADRCALCHSATGCDDCHRTRTPRSHNAFWMLRGHGVVAGIDRNRCEVCHDRDGCDACHSETQPMSHNAAFKGPLNRHCLSCHLPMSTTDDCIVCHKDAPAHELAPPLLNNTTHQQATEQQCRACHAPVPHPDNGQSCRFCHF